MKDSGYYEIKSTEYFDRELKAGIVTGNVQFNALHWHENLEILCCLKGSFKLRVDGNVYKMSEGDLVTINSGAIHEIFDGTGDGLQIVFSADSSLLYKKDTELYEFSTVGDYALDKNCHDIADARSSLGRMAWLLTPYVKDFKYVGRIPVLKNESEWNSFHKELYNVLLHISEHKRESEDVKNMPAPNTHFTACIEILHREYHEPLNAAILAERVGVSEPTVYRMFQKYLGISLTDYLNSIRVSAVCGYLENTDYSIIEISSICGFSSLSNFYRVFNLYKGQTPKEYRKVKEGRPKLQKISQKDIMGMNHFRNFWQLRYSRDELLI